MYTSIFVEIVD